MNKRFIQKSLSQFIALTAIAGGALPVLADAQPQATPYLEQVLVTASRIEESIGSVAGKVQVIDGAQVLEQIQPGDTLAIALGKLIPNLGVGTETATGATQTVRGRKPLYLIDGVPQSDNRGPH